MITTREQVGAIVFSALMLVSVAGGSIAVSGFGAADESVAHPNSDVDISRPSGVPNISASPGSENPPASTGGTKLNEIVNHNTIIASSPTASTDEAGVVSSEWTSGDRSDGTVSTPLHTYNGPDQYTAGLIITDDSTNTTNNIIIQNNSTETGVNTWKSETIAYGFKPDISVYNQSLHVGFYGGSDIRYALLNSEGWSTELIDSGDLYSGNSGLQRSVAVGPSGEAYIVYTYDYIDPTVRKIKYARGSASQWSLSEIEDRSTDEPISIDINRSSGRPIALLPGGLYNNLVLAERSAGMWDKQTTNLSGQIADEDSLIYDSNGRPHILYAKQNGETGNYSIHYAVRQGGNWSKSAVVESIQTPRSDFTLDSDGQPHILYISGSDDLVHASRNNTGWSYNTVRATNSTNSIGGASIASGPTGIHTSYVLTIRQSRYETENRYLWYGKRASGQWNQQRVSANFDSLDTTTDLAVASDGTPHILVEDRFHLKHISPTNSNISSPPRFTDIELNQSSNDAKESDIQKYDIVLQNSSGGVGGYNITITLSNSTIAKFADVEPEDRSYETVIADRTNAQSVRRYISSDMDKVRISTSGGTTNKSGPVKIATFGIQPSQPGIIEINASLNTAPEVFNRQYNIADGSATVESWSVVTEENRPYTVNNTANTTVSISDATFSIDETDLPQSVTAGETLTVNVTVSNTGEISGTQAVKLSTNGTERDTESITLPPNESETVSLNWRTTDDDAGQYTVALSSDDSTEKTMFSVESPPNFTTEINTMESSSTVGETINITAETTNTGDIADTQTIALVINGTQRDSAQISLEPGESDSIKLTWPTTDGDAGEYTATISSNNGTATAPLTINKPANFTTTVDSITSPVVAGGLVGVNVSIKNTGDIADTQTIALVINGTQRDSAQISLGPNESDTTTLTWLTAGEDVGKYTATIGSSNDTATSELIVNEPANFTTQIDTPTSPVVAGDLLSVNVSINNTGDVADTQTLALTVNGTQRDSAQVSLDAGESESITLTWVTTDGDAGEYTVTVSSNNDTETSSIININSPPAATIGYTADPFYVNQTVKFNASQSTDSDGEITKYEWDFDGDSQFEKTGLRVNHSFSEAGEYDITLRVTDNSSATDIRSETIQVTRRPVNLDITANTSSVLTGDTVRFSVARQDTNTPVNASIIVNNSQVSTGSDGQAIYAFKSGGDFTATVRKANTSTKQYNSDNVTVSVEKRTVGLLLRVNRTAVEVTDTVAVDIRRKDTNQSVNATIQINGTTFQTGPDGQASYRIKSRGGVTLTVSKPDTRGVSFISNSTDLNVSKKTVQLDIAANQLNTTTGESVQVSLTRNDTGEAVSGTVHADGSIFETGENGLVTLSLTTTGQQVITAAKPNTSTTTFRNDSITITVEEPTGNLTLTPDVTNSPAQAGGNLNVTTVVTNTGDGVATEVVSLRVDGTERDSRELTLTPNESQTVTLAWDTERTDSGNYTAVVSAGSATLSIPAVVHAPGNFSLRVNSTTAPVTEGETMAIGVNVTNRGKATATQTISLSVGGIQRDSQTVTLGSGESRRISLSWVTNDDDAGNYTASISGANRTAEVPVRVEEDSDSNGTDPSTVTLTSENVTAKPGANATVSFAVRNDGIQRSIILNISAPENVTVIKQSPDGASWNRNDTAWLWQTVDSGETVQPSLTVAVPENVTTVGLGIVATAKSDGGIVATETARISPVSLTVANAAGSGENTTVEFNTTNLASDSGLILNLSIPSEVSVVDVSSAGGQWSATRQAWAYQTVKTGESVRPSLTVSVQENASGPFSITGYTKTADGVAAIATTEVPCDSVPQALDEDGDRQIGDFEILRAIGLWRSGDEVPGTCGQTIGDFQILELIEKWRFNRQV